VKAIHLKGDRECQMKQHERLSRWPDTASLVFPHSERESPRDSVPDIDFLLLPSHKRASFQACYTELDLYKAVLWVYTKSLFSWRKALSRSHDGQTLYDFAWHTRQNVEQLHTALLRQEFHFREGIELHYNFNGKHRTIYIFPWEERIVDLLLYRALSRFFHSAFSSHSYAYRYRGFGVDLCQYHITRCLHKSPQPVYFIKRDIADYFSSVDHDILLRMLKQWVELDDYLYELLEERAKFRVRTSDKVKTAERGIPFGTAIACFFANLYLTPLDHQMATVPSLSYYRYADDILAFSHSREAITEGEKRLDSVLAKLKLDKNPRHSQNFMLSADGNVNDDTFQSASRFRHLGLEFRSDGSVGLSRDKGRKIRNLFRFAFRRAQRKLLKRHDPERRVELLVDIARNVVEKGVRSVAIIDYYLKHVDDEEQLRLIDRWLAEEILSRVFNNGHHKGNFAKLSFKRLRDMGLPSLRHRWRLLHHGRLQYSFFVLWTERIIERERRRLSGLWTFSPSLEAAANRNPVRKGAACR